MAKKRRRIKRTKRKISKSDRELAKIDRRLKSINEKIAKPLRDHEKFSGGLLRSYGYLEQQYQKLMQLGLGSRVAQIDTMIGQIQLQMNQMAQAMVEIHRALQASLAHHIPQNSTGEVVKEWKVSE